MDQGEGVVVDANVIAKVIEELRLKQINGVHYELIDKILSKFGIVICPVIKREYQNTCGGLVFKYWFEGERVQGKIRQIKPELEQQKVDRIHNYYGLPKGKNGRDLWYIKCANVTITKYILSEDIDLYDPQMKEKLRGDQRVKFMNERKGKLLKFLENELKPKFPTQKLKRVCCKDIPLNFCSVSVLNSCLY